MTSSQPTSNGDRVIRAMTDDGAFRVMTIRSTDTVRDAAEAQRVRGTPAAQLAELMTAAVLVRETMAPPNRVQVVLRDRHGNQIVGDAFPEGRTRGLVRVEDDALGVMTAEGGYLRVERSLPARAPHQGVIELEPEGGIDKALMAYFRDSEQVATMTAVHCVLDDGDVRAAGGYVVQLLPEVTEPPLESMRRRLRAFQELGAELAAQDADPQWLLETLLAGCEFTRLAESPVLFACQCGADKAVGATAALGEAQLRDILAKGEPVRVHCDYCRTAYEVGLDEIRRMLEPRS